MSNRSFRTVFNLELTRGDIWAEAYDAKPGVLVMGVENGEYTTTVNIDREAAMRLHEALAEWLYPVHTPEGRNRSFIEQLIDRAVKDQVAAVLPLHLKTVATHRPQECPGVGECPEADPEPHDVGHPVYEDSAPERQPEPEPEPEPELKSKPVVFLRRPVRCIECMHSWADHTSGVCWGIGEHIGGPGAYCLCTRERP